jgi:hypothetical protein
VEVPPLRPSHLARVAGEVKRTDADVPPEARRLRAVTAATATAMLRGEPRSPALVATADGAIARMLLTIPGYAAGGEDNPYALVYRDLLAKLPAEIELVILTHDAAAATVGAWLGAAARGAHARVVATDDFLGFSVWAEDGYAVVTEEDGSAAFVEPAAFPRYGDALVAERVAAAVDMGLFQAPLHLQGGNVLIGDDFFFVGVDYPLLTFAEGILTAPPGTAEEEVIRAVYRRYLDAERRFVPVGTTLPVPPAAMREFRLDGETWQEELYAGNAPGTRQPIFHIDMFVSLAGRAADGRYRVLVGDPREAARLTGEPLQPHAMAEAFDDIARGLAARGFDVGRAPLPLVYEDDPQARLRSWYFATSNNALVHAPAGGRPTVLLPTYGHGPFEALRETDRRHAEIWTGLGYDVVALADFHPFARNLGAAHCIKKYLARR